MVRTRKYTHTPVYISMYSYAYMHKHVWTHIYLYSVSSFFGSTGLNLGLHIC
jgi:hypothetical protein